ncbi:G/U mismatch-specific uracil DNA glycosylase [Colletotrichum spinosum]|uniref:G/U mismatch-specific uracil DNA glycosylase n=1 Tax=Colletotrichum spinosum TaxID=1347390 RepID=A0A4R8QU08_9PEZI|nr:G/U mismatch-specific uracil DNA glycosylase [Colletotrichum spinosum]
MESPFFDGAEPQPQKASFRGRLPLQDFMFNQPATASQNTAKASPHSPSPSPSPLRRNPRRTTPLGPVSPTRVTKKRCTAVTASSKLATTARDSTASTPQQRPPLAPDAAADNSNSDPGPKSKRKRQNTGYAPPSTYAHLAPLIDILAPNLLILFVGLNPGLQTARAGHAYAHPSNLFWKLLFSSGITPRLCSPTEDRDLPALYGLGNTNIVSRPSRNGSELSKAEMDAGVDVLEEKVRGCRPETVCIVGKSIWESVWRVRHGRGIKKDEFKYGWQDEGENMGVVNGVDGEFGWAGAKVFVATSTSGLAASLRPAEKEKIWRELGEWCERRRVERGKAG